MAEQKQWDRFAQWAGIGNNRRDVEAMEGTVGDSVMHEEQVEAGEGGSGSGGEAGGQENVLPFEASHVELEQVKGERDQLRDRLARLQAEFDNARKREAKERTDAREYTVSSTVEPFLGVMDNFNLALRAEGSAEQLRSGVELILKQMEEALRGLNVQAVETVGAQFDPRIHEALGSIETAEYPDQQVMEEIRKGYKIRERLLRPALVRIASSPAQVAD